MKTYQEKKDAARLEAQEYQASYYNPKFELSYSELAEITAHFERIGRCYGLLTEFRENGII